MVARSFLFPAAVVVLAALVVGSHPARADYARGVAAYGRGDYAGAVREFGESARTGDARSEYMLGRLYAMGLGVPQDLVRAWVWEDRAARQGKRNANDERVTLEGIMTPAQLAQAHAEAPRSADQDLPPVPVTDIGAFPPTTADGHPKVVTIAPSGMPLVDGTAPVSGDPSAPAVTAGAGRRILVPHRAGVVPAAPIPVRVAAAGGLSAHQVRLVQRDLNRAGYSTGPVDGRMGPLTRHAIRNWQRDHGLAPTGRITPEMLPLLHPPPSPPATAEAGITIGSPLPAGREALLAP
ncbi:MAG: peptidoglycan-binding protein [Magnetospirillum sp.]|nr:peptidoglycan-binding protein [Magnetospirillum sp.]